MKFFKSSYFVLFLIGFSYLNIAQAEPVNHKELKELKELKKLYIRPSKVPYLEDNVYSSEKEILGRMLFFDPRLSGSGMISCSSCHNPSLGWSDGLQKGVGQSHKQLGRRSPSILNLAWTEKMMWDGRFKHLEGQALGPLSSPDEMNMDMSLLPKKLEGINGYVKLFQNAFPGQPITNDQIAKALAIYERKIISGTAPFDKWIAGDEKAITAEAKMGFIVFNKKANCAACHSGWRFTDDSFHDIGVKSEDIGRGKFLKIQSQQFAFKTPGLRNITSRPPYMHDGSESSIDSVIEFYNRGGDVIRESHSAMMKPLQLSNAEKQQVKVFLETLTSKDKSVDYPVLPR